VWQLAEDWNSRDVLQKKEFEEQFHAQLRAENILRPRESFMETCHEIGIMEDVVDLESGSRWR
jgi:hypothetical protein